MNNAAITHSPVTFTIDLEDHLGVYAGNGRWLRNTQTILDFCTQKRIRATFFTVGKVAAHPELLKRIVNDGHELALHSYDHIALTQENPATYAAHLLDAKKAFEDITGKAVEGFRAPIFSLTPKSVWAVDVLKELGFIYSSSVIAGKGAVNGFPGVPNKPFTWKNGLIELPVPMVNLGVLALPFLGGVYLRYLPLPLVEMLKKTVYADALLWTYTHPYDVDASEGYVRLDDGTPLWMNMLLMNNRKHFLKKLDAVLDGNTGAPLIERARGLNHLPQFDL